MLLSAREIGAVAFFVGFPMSAVPTATAIALAESSGNTNAVNRNANGSTDHGLWQINDKAHADLITKYGNINDPIANGKAALAVYKAAGNSFTPWSTYTSGAYKHFLTSSNTSAAKDGANNDLETIQSFPNDSTITAKASSPLDNLTATLTNPLNAVGSALNTLTSPATWLRVALIVGGALVVMVGIVFMVESDKSVQSVTKLAAIA